MSRRPALLGEAPLGDAVDRLVETAAPRTVVPGWATVDLDRAAEELSGVGTPGDTDDRLPDPPDLHLGARSQTLLAAGDVAAILLEASTEGPLAAALARHGEGWIALYMITDQGATERVRGAGFVVSTLRDGPLGPQRLVRISPVSGPFLVLVTPD
ncbi:MAG: hypothetical protein ABI573_10465 [Chloroflexota bacterium]